MRTVFRRSNVRVLFSLVAVWFFVQDTGSAATPPTAQPGRLPFISPLKINGCKRVGDFVGCAKP
jgi:hypothetical protein